MIVKSSLQWNIKEIGTWELDINLHQNSIWKWKIRIISLIILLRNMIFKNQYVENIFPKIWNSLKQAVHRNNKGCIFFFSLFAFRKIMLFESCRKACTAFATFKDMYKDWWIKNTRYLNKLCSKEMNENILMYLRHVHFDTRIRWTKHAIYFIYLFLIVIIIRLSDISRNLNLY